MEWTARSAFSGNDMTRIRVVHVTTRFIRGGADENTLFTVNGLDPSRFQVSLIIGHKSEATIEERLSSRVGVHRVPDMVRDIAPKEDTRAFLHLVRIFRRLRPHVVHTHMAKAGIIGRFAALAARVPVVVHTLHGATFHEHLVPWQYHLFWSLEKVSGLFTHQLISVGEDLMKRYMDAGIAEPGKYRLIRSGMELDEFMEAGRLEDEALGAVRRSMGVPENATVVGMVARLEARKGHEYFLDVAEAVSRRFENVHFVAVGDGELHETLREEVSARGMAENVHFPGFRQDIAPVMASFDVVVLTSLWEGLPRVLVQAAAVGRPVVTFSVEGAWEVVKEGRNGYIVEAKDVQTMIARVSTLLENREKAREMGATGRLLVHEGWSKESMVREIEQVYESLLAKHAESGRGSV